jgi:tetratricopeptide (TPR) repeat protein
MFYRCLCVITFWYASAATLWGQSLPAGAASVCGEVIWEGERRADSLFVELRSVGQLVDRVPVMPDGRFELQGVTSGEYELRVADLHETIIQRQFVSVHGHVDGLVFRLEGAERARPVSGTVTVNSLLHPAPAAARKEFLRAAKAAQKGAPEESIRHLRKALVIFPAYIEAHNDLGVRYMQQGAYEQAAAEFQEAVKLDPVAVRPITNLALAWITLRRYADAESAARRAIAADPGFPPARCALSLARWHRLLVPSGTANDKTN